MRPIWILTGHAAALLVAAVAALPPATALAQAADWQSVVWREPQVRYLLADMTLGGNVQLYRDYATTERDPDSREAVRLWDAGVRVINKDAFERKWVANPHGKDGRVMRVVLRGSNRTIAGDEVLLGSDLGFEQAPMRLVILDLTLGASAAAYEARKAEPAVAEALRRWADGARATNAAWFETPAGGGARRIVYRGTDRPADGAAVRLNCDRAYPETNVRYFLADMHLGGSRDFYHRVAESAHEMGCREAVARFDAGATVTNLDQLERKKVDGKVVITRKGSDRRVSGGDVKLSTD
jgi:hypothetical protein